MKNCIFWTVYGDSRYLELARVSVESFAYHRYDCDLIVVTDVPDAFDFFSQEVLVKSEKFCGGPSSKMSKRFDTASSLLEEYDRVLHVDTDVIAIRPYSKIFEITSDKLSFASESPPPEFQNTCFEVGNPNDRAVGEFWAGPLLTPEEIKAYADTPSICVGVWLANKLHQKWLRQIHNEVVDFEKAGFAGPCVDQHAVVRNLVLNKRWDLQLQSFVTHNGQRLHREEDYQRLWKSTNSIVHFAGGVQPTAQKMSMMRESFLRSKND